jgi:DNA-binding transcriptional ArsR family regulator
MVAVSLSREQLVGTNGVAAAGPSSHQAGLANLLQVLADGTRLRLLLALSHGERNVTDLMEHLRLPQPTVSHHLGILRMNGVVQSRRDGKRVFYRLSEPPPTPGTLRFTAAGATVDLTTP